MKYWILIHKRTGKIATDNDAIATGFQAPPIIYMSRKEARTDRREMIRPDDWTTGTVKLKTKKAR